jgi:hypothetical protein
MSERNEHLSEDEDSALEEAERASADLPGQIAHARRVVRDFRRALTAPRPDNDNRRRDRRH